MIDTLGLGIKLKKFAKWTENYTWRNANYVLPVTRVLANIIKQQANVPEERVKVIPNGIDPEKWQYIKTASIATTIGAGIKLDLKPILSTSAS